MEIAVLSPVKTTLVGVAHDLKPQACVRASGRKRRREPSVSDTEDRPDPRPERDKDDTPDTPPTEPLPVPIQEPPPAPEKEGPYIA
jgi:hypothetical protein